LRITRPVGSRRETAFAALGAEVVFVEIDLATGDGIIIKGHGL
jgi:hypothetical protein